MTVPPPRPTAWTLDRRVLSGSLWLASGLLLVVGVTLLAGLAVALLAFAAWCMGTSVLIWRRP